jgi:Region found in RelA / SpoT proteins
MTRIGQAQIAASDWDDPTRRFARDWVIGPVNDFPRTSYSMKDVKRAGELIAGRHPMNPETQDAFLVANSWREDHAYPMRSIRCQLIWYMRQLELEGVTAARLKRMQAIRRKLTRIGLNLGQLQDLGGCRAIVPKIADVSILVGVLRDRSRHHLRAENDYIANPKKDGYRSHHLMFCFRGRGTAKYYNDRRIEVQIRTRMQHSWATAVEAVGLFRSEDLKGNKGNADWLRLFQLMSAEFAVAEGCPELRIPTKSAGNSERRRPPLPIEAGRGFR